MAKDDTFNGSYLLQITTHTLIFWLKITTTYCLQVEYWILQELTSTLANNVVLYQERSIHARSNGSRQSQEFIFGGPNKKEND